jgi:DNA repair protein RadC
MVNAYGIVIIHNHPSGDSKPSKHDINFTTKLLRSCEDLRIEFHNRILIGDDSYYSFAEHGLL